ncbi:uncharacterized protein ASCRUDRAFT_76814 [Ascoidea rubescens DSM 1968]|uniref:Uncharacterized protein n=1 Tax=Ascoidea rubescens DSM 1968 TaxID=1344418 RepID=A0A1D2VDZ7_9ASCO|nr:hypothetical protein ASCRUDRAFT_76814 [Ascoidea rubescens DSM 1968]ODV59871.1 hypothetical protein ASCRUDRAFT_76814 [Ascoidea rubescens DSM 1968]
MKSRLKSRTIFQIETSELCSDKKSLIQATLFISTGVQKTTEHRPATKHVCQSEHPKQ